jgi:hypothetical protein
MISYHCDGCGKELSSTSLRYTVKIDVRAAYDTVEVGLQELVRDHRAEMIKLIEAMKDQNPAEIEETVYKGLKLDLCPSCQRAFINDPLRFHPEQGSPSAINIDDFLRSLGYGKTEDQ